MVGLPVSLVSEDISIAFSIQLWLGLNQGKKNPIGRLGGWACVSGGEIQVTTSVSVCLSKTETTISIVH